MSRRAHSRNWLGQAIGLGATVLLHGLFLQSATLGSVASKHSVPEEVGPGASSILAANGSFMSLVIVHLPGPSDESFFEEVASRGDAESNPVIQIVSPDPTPSVAMPELEFIDESSEATVTAGDPALQSLLFGRYTGQVDARIRRAWIRPRGPVSDASAVESSPTMLPDLFRCNARISQDNAGYVKEVELINCNGTPEWQLSLVQAIQRASPLPAPRSPTVFTNALTLSFDARAYAPSVREDEYETVVARVERD